MTRSLSSRNARAAASELHSSGGLGIGRPVEASNASKCTRSGEPTRGAIHWKFAERSGGHAPAPRERMLGAHDDGQRIVEQMLLHDVAGRSRIAQRADEHVGFARAQAREQVLVGALDDRDAMPRMLLRELEQRRRQ